MKVVKVSATTAQLADPEFADWQSIDAREFTLVPTPLKGNPGIKAISPFIEKSTDHGAVDSLQVRSAHNGEHIAIRLNWASDRHDSIVDLDQFVDGAAVMFPLTERATAITMGSPDDPVNAWYWKANLENTAFDVVAQGYGTSMRRNQPQLPIGCRAAHKNGAWQLVLTRALNGAQGRVDLKAGASTRMAFAIWDGGNRERSGRKSFSGDFVPCQIDA